MANETFKEIQLHSSYYIETNDEQTVLSYVNEVTYILGVIFVVGMFLNLASLIAIIRTSKLEPITLLIVNLALADIVYIAGMFQLNFQ